jgi:DDE_Tnp_1-associated
MLDLNCATIQGTGGLLERLAAITDPRAKRGVRHRLVSLLAIAAAAALSGAKSLSRLGSSPASCPRRHSPGWAPDAIR